MQKSNIPKENKHMLQISGKDLVNFLNRKEGKLAEWWFSELGLQASQQKYTGQLIDWGIQLTAAADFGGQFFWLDFKPPLNLEGWKGRYRRLLIKLID